MFLVLRLVRRVVTVLVTIAVLVVGVTAARVWWTARHDDRRHSDVILVMGASQLDGRPSDLLLARLEHALALWKAKVAPVVVTVGGKAPGDRFTEAGSGRTWLLEHGVPAKDLVAVETGRDTLQSARAAAAVMRTRHWHTAVLVTDPWHVLRARAMVHDSGVDVVASPTRSGPSVASRSVELRYIGRETIGYIVYLAFHGSLGTG